MKTIEKVTRENYIGQEARFLLGGKLLNLLAPIYEAVDEARKNEMSFSDNNTVDPADFDDLKNKLGEVVRAAMKLQKENKLQ